MRKSSQLTAAILPTLSALLFHFFHFLSLLSCLLFPKKTLKCIKTKEVRARRAYQKRERERMDGASSSSSSSSDDDDTVGAGGGDKSLGRKKKKKTGLQTSELLSKTGMSFDTSQFLDVERRKEMIERGKKDAMEDVVRSIRFGGGGGGGGGGVDGADVAKNKERRTVSKTMSLFTVEEHLRIVAQPAVRNFCMHILALTECRIDEATCEDVQKLLDSLQKEFGGSNKANIEALCDAMESKLFELSKTLVSGWRGKAIFSGIEDGNGDDNNINSNNNSTDLEAILDYLIATTCHECIENVCVKLDEETNIDIVVFPRLVRFARNSALKLGGETNPYSHELNRFSEKVSQALKRGLATIEISEVIENELPAVLRAYNLRFLRDLKKNKHLRISTTGNANGSSSHGNTTSHFSNDSNRRRTFTGAHGSLSLNDVASLPSQSPEKRKKNKNSGGGGGYFFGLVGGGTDTNTSKNRKRQRREEKKKAFETVRSQKTALDAQDALLISWIRSALEVREDFFDEDDSDSSDDDDDSDDGVRGSSAAPSTAPSSSVAIRSGLVLTGSQVVKDWQREDGFTLKRRCRTSKPDFLSKDGDPVDEDDDTDIWTTENLSTGPFQAHFTRALSSLENALRRAKTCKTEATSVASAARVILAASRTARGGEELELCTSLFGDPPYFAVLGLNSREYDNKLDLGGPPVEIFVEENRVTVQCRSVYEITRHPIDDDDFANDDALFMPIPWCAIAISYTTILETNPLDGILEVKRTRCGLNKRVSQKRLNRFLRNKHTGTGGKSVTSANVNDNNSNNNEDDDDKEEGKRKSKNMNTKSSNSADSTDGGGILNSLFSAVFNF